MTMPREYSYPHDWELCKNLPSLVDYADASDQRSCMSSGSKCEWHKCKRCGARATKWLSGELEGKYVYNPSGGIGPYQLSYDVPCELAAKYRDFCMAADEFLDSFMNSGGENRFYQERLKERCVNILMQAFVDQCDHPEEHVSQRPNPLDDFFDMDGVEEVICMKCGGSCCRKAGEDPGRWYSHWSLHERDLNGYIEERLKLLREL